MDGRLRLLLSVPRHRHLRRVALAYGLFAIAENATWIAVTVYAFGRGGVREAGIIVVVQLAPSIVVAPLAASAGDRFRKDRVLGLGYVAQAVSMLATATAMWTVGNAVVVYAAATAAAAAVTFTRPAMRALLPIATSTPAELTAANVCIGVIEHLGVFLGPAVAGILLHGGGGPALVFTAMAGATATAAASVTRLGIDRSLMIPPADVGAGDVYGDVLGGFRALRLEADLRLLIIVGALGTVVTGAADVLFVVVADGLAEDSAGVAGLLGAAFGLGALFGSVASASLVGRANLVTPLALAVGVAAAASALMGAVSHVVPILALFVLAGASCSLARIAGASLVPRFAPASVLSRVFGVMEGLDMAALAVGAAGVSALVGLLGLRTGLVVLGATMLAPLVVRAGRLRRIGAATPAPSEALTRLVLANPIFANLPPPALERLLATMQHHRFAPGVEVIRQGDEGDRYYLVEGGELAVFVDGAPARTLRAADGFGEIALVRDVPRTATVITTTPVSLYSVRRGDFLAALGHHTGLAVVEQHAQRLLDDDTSRGRLPGSEAFPSATPTPEP